VNERGVEVHMVLMCPECSLADHIVEQVRRKAQSVVGEPVEVVVLDEAWRWSDAVPYFTEGGGI
jgi:metal-sulfur cluster biosynthetic enzyme